MVSLSSRIGYTFYKGEWLVVWKKCFSSIYNFHIILELSSFFVSFSLNRVINLGVIGCDIKSYRVCFLRWRGLCWNAYRVEINGIHLYSYTVTKFFYNYSHQSNVVEICHGSRATSLLQIWKWDFYIVVPIMLNYEVVCWLYGTI